MIKSLIEQGVQPRNIAVLYRVTWLMHPIETQLMESAVPYVVWSGATFYERREIRDLLAYLRIGALRDPDERNIKRAINAPFRYIGRAFVGGVEAFAQEKGLAFASPFSLSKNSLPGELRSKHVHQRCQQRGLAADVQNNHSLTAKIVRWLLEGDVRHHLPTTDIGPDLSAIGRDTADIGLQRVQIGVIKRFHSVTINDQLKPPAGEQRA